MQNVHRTLHILLYHTTSTAKSAKLLHPGAGVVSKEIELIND